MNSDIIAIRKERYLRHKRALFIESELKRWNDQYSEEEVKTLTRHVDREFVYWTSTPLEFQLVIITETDDDDGCDNRVVFKSVVDIRPLMIEHLLDTKSALLLPETYIPIIKELWNIVNPYKHVRYITEKQHTLNVEHLFHNYWQTSDILNNLIVSRVLAPTNIIETFQKSAAYGAYSFISLPAKIVNRYLAKLEFQNVLAIEITVPNSGKRVYAYCTNPDVESQNYSAGLPEILCRLLNVRSQNIVHIKLVHPFVCANDRNVISIVLQPLFNTAAIGDNFEACLQECLNHHRILYVSQVIFVYINNFPHIYKVVELHAQNQKYVPMLQIFHGDYGIDFREPPSDYDTMTPNEAFQMWIAKNLQ